MQRFLIFILIVVLACIVLTRAFMTGLDPVPFVASASGFNANAQPVFNNNQILMQTTWTQAQLVYLSKILMLVFIVLIAVLNYKKFISEPESEEN
jgi:hypothetical protein